MYEQVKALKAGQSVDKPIYNHVSGLLDPAEKTDSPKILIIEGLHPFYDDRVNDLIDFRIYLGTLSILYSISMSSSSLSL